MNPNLAQTLDPKLKETYDRVMGTQVNSQPSQPPAQKPVEPAPPLQAKPIEPAPMPTPMAPSPSVNQVFVSEDTKKTVNINPNEATTLKKPKKTSPVIFIVLGAVFFGAYTFIWLKVFGIV